MLKNKRGFTLIELLAVIVILGILMIIAIPAVSKYIENSKENTMINNVKSYAKGVQTAYSSNDILCTTGAKNGTATAADYVIDPQDIEEGNFFIPITTHEYWKTTSQSNKYKRGQPYQNAERLMDSIQKSPWDNDYSGVVEIEKKKESDETIVTYKIGIIELKHRILNTTKPYPLDVSPLDRKNIKKGTATSDNIKSYANFAVYINNAGDAGNYMCIINE